MFDILLSISVSHPLCWLNSIDNQLHIEIDATANITDVVLDSLCLSTKQYFYDDVINAFCQLRRAIVIVLSSVSEFGEEETTKIDYTWSDCDDSWNGDLFKFLLISNSSRIEVENMLDKS